MEITLSCCISGSHHVSTHIWEEGTREDAYDRYDDHEFHEGESMITYWTPRGSEEGGVIEGEFTLYGSEVVYEQYIECNHESK